MLQLVATRTYEWLSQSLLLLKVPRLKADFFHLLDCSNVKNLNWVPILALLSSSLFIVAKLRNGPLHLVRDRLRDVSLKNALQLFLFFVESLFLVSLEFLVQSFVDYVLSLFEELENTMSRHKP